MMENTWKAFKDYILNIFGFNLTDNQIDYFKIYLSELKNWNQKFNLVSFKTDEEVIFRHFADSLAGIKTISKHLKKTNSIADIGTGAGFPGIPIKICLPDSSLTLIESIEKKCTFLDNIKTKLSLTETDILNDRAENIGQNIKHRESYDFVLSRAATKFSPNLEIALPLVKIGGYFIVYKTESSAFGSEGVNTIDKAVNTLGGEFVDHFTYNLPGQNLTYCILVFEKVKTTPKEFPRRVGVPEKKPL